MTRHWTEKDFHLFLRNELRTDGWESEWQKDLKRRMQEEAYRPRPIVKAEQIKARQEKA